VVQGEHPDWSIITKTIQLANKAVVMKAIIKNAEGRIIATARKKETEVGFPDYIEKAETGAVDGHLHCADMEHYKRQSWKKGKIGRCSG